MTQSEPDDSPRPTREEVRDRENDLELTEVGRISDAELALILEGLSLPSSGHSS